MIAHYPLALASALSLLLVGAPAPAAQLSVGTGSSLSLGDNRLDLGCADLAVAGSVSLGTGTIEGARDLGGAGALDAGLGTLRVAGDWLPDFGFATSNATVEFVDGCGRAATTIFGDNSFGGLQLLTTAGKYFAFEAGRTQTILDWFELQGTSGSPATIRSTVAGLAAILDLGGQGFGEADAADVDDIYVVGGFASIDPASTLGSNTSGFVSPVNVPATSSLALWVACLGFLTLGSRLVAARARAGTRAR